MCKSDYENAWVCHEIGRAYLEMGNFARSRQSSIKAYKFAVACGDSLWMLHSSVLQAQTEAKMGELQSAYETFGVALNHANEVGDTQAAPAIRRALKDIKLRLVRRGRGASHPGAGGGGGDEGAEGGEGEEDDGGDGGGDEGAFCFLFAFSFSCYSSFVYFFRLLNSFYFFCFVVVVVAVVLFFFVFCLQEEISE